MDASAVDPFLLAQGPLPAYRARRDAGNLTRNSSQERAAERLQELWVKLRGYDPAPKPAGNAGLLGLFSRRKTADWANEDRHGGLYLVGEVGRGKTMLMDLFFAAALVKRKRRIHFHSFMQDTHKRIHAWKRANPKADDPIPPLADAIAAEAALLCFDEFQVNDIVDAMILGRLFQALFERSVVVVATSNTLPDDLFKGQPGRDAFLPFIGLLKQTLDVLVLEPGQDYRRERLRGMPTWYVPAGARAEQALDAAFAELAGDAPVRQPHLLVMGRTLEVPIAAGGVARFDFPTLVRSRSRGRRLSGAGDPFPQPGAGRHPPPVAGQFRRGAPLHRADRYVVRPPRRSWWPPPMPDRTSCMSAAKGRRCSSGRRAGWRKCRARNIWRCRT